MTEKKTCRNMCFTINHWTKKEVEVLKKMKYNYLIYAHEYTEEGEPHLQGYIEFKNSCAFSTLKKKLPRAWWKTRDGTAKQASDYCKKEESFREFGELSEQGRRVDLDNIRTMLDAGESMLTVARGNFQAFCQYNKAFEKYQYLMEEELSQNNREISIDYYWGDTNTGKSHRAREENPGIFSISEGITGMWWTGYRGQEAVLFDDFRGTIPLHILLKYLDKYPVQVPVHCGYKWLRATKIVITSNIALDELYKNTDERSKTALWRRINNIVFFDKQYSNDKN